jgi:hypothetical protein
VGLEPPPPTNGLSQVIQPIVTTNRMLFFRAVRE